ncbi:hypothetical protein Droror1_Dr00022297, partial [Drosera rotundifolia]
EIGEEDSDPRVVSPPGPAHQLAPHASGPDHHEGDTQAPEADDHAADDSGQPPVVHDLGLSDPVGLSGPIATDLPDLVSASKESMAQVPTRRSHRQPHQPSRLADYEPLPPELSPLNQSCAGGEVSAAAFPGDPWNAAAALSQSAVVFLLADPSSAADQREPRRLCPVEGGGDRSGD